MADKSNTQIIIRHIAGAKINRIDPFSLADTNEVTFGREAGTNITFDSPKDDVVSRKHAVLRVKSREPLKFAIEDLKSSNGTFLNGEKITGESEILPEDTVEFGKGGPKFTFDIQPRPASMVARTRVMNAIDATATRAVATTAIVSAQTGQTAATASQAAAEPKAGVGKNTVMMMLSNERKKTSQVWMAAVAALVTFIVVGGGVLYWRMQQESEAQAARAAAEAQARAQAAATQQISAVTSQMGMSPGEIATKYGNSTVWIQFQWRLYDKETGRPVYHKAWTEVIDGKRVRLPAYLKYGDKVMPWLTTEDEEHRNYELRSGGSGTGFVVNPQGFILTNRHVGASWMESLAPSDYLDTDKAFLLTKEKGRVTQQIVSLSSLNLKRWVPEDDGGLLFPSRLRGEGRTLDLPDIAQKSSIKTFYGKNDTLSVRFPHSRLSINAELVRTSTDEDVALLKVSSPEPLVALELAGDDNVKVGEKVMALGYPGLSMSTYMTIENDRTGQRRQEVIPEPTVTDGIVQKLGIQTTQEGTRRIEGSQGDTIQVSIHTGPGNSGGPVFNAEGKVIGLITFLRQSSGVTFTYAVRIRHGRNLLSPQLIR
jgi:S1-C subfamily serine protease